MPLIPAVWEAEVRGLQIGVQPELFNNSPRPCLKIKNKAGDIVRCEGLGVYSKYREEK